MAAGRALPPARVHALPPAATGLLQACPPAPCAPLPLPAPTPPCPSANNTLQPLGEERLVGEREDHGRPDAEHILSGFPVCPHEVEPRQRDCERDCD